MPLRPSMDLKATACSRFLVNLLNFQTRMTWKGAVALLPSSIIRRNWGRSAILPLSGLVHVLAGHGVAVVLCVVAERPKLGGNGKIHVLAVAGDPGVQGRRGQGLQLFFISSSCSLFWFGAPWRVRLGTLLLSDDKQVGCIKYDWHPISHCVVLLEPVAQTCAGPQPRAVLLVFALLST